MGITLSLLNPPTRTGKGSSFTAFPSLICLVFAARRKTDHRTGISNLQDTFTNWPINPQPAPQVFPDTIH